MADDRAGAGRMTVRGLVRELVSGMVSRSVGQMVGEMVPKSGRADQVPA
jgi:hypothetical protein